MRTKTEGKMHNGVDVPRPADAYRVKDINVRHMVRRLKH